MLFQQAGGGSRIVSPTWNLVADLQQVFQYEFMQNAFGASQACQFVAPTGAVHAEVEQAALVGNRPFDLKRNVGPAVRAERFRSFHRVVIGERHHSWKIQPPLHLRLFGLDQTRWRHRRTPVPRTEVERVAVLVLVVGQALLEVAGHHRNPACDGRDELQRLA